MTAIDAALITRLFRWATDRTLWRDSVYTANRPSSTSESYELLVIGGPPGVGKSSVGQEVAYQLKTSRIGHAYIEGDCMDWCYPRRPDMFEKNVAALWANYAADGCRRLIYTNTASIGSADRIAAAMGGQTRVFGVLLTCTTETARQRLTQRETGKARDWHIERTDAVGKEFASIDLPDWAIRVPTDQRTTADIAGEIVQYTGWLTAYDPS